MKKLILLFFAASVFAQENPYETIVKRNAFTLLNEVPVKIELPKILEKPPIKLNLTGIIVMRGVTNVYIYSKDIPNRFLTLSTKKRTNSGVTLLSVERGLVEVDNNGVIELLSFDTHKLPSTTTLPSLKTKSTIVKKKDNKSNSVKITPQTPKPNIVTVPSRRPKIDPKIIQKGLEYLDKVEDKEKKEYMLQRLEKLQSGQERIDRKIETNERRRQYDERRNENKKKYNNKK